MRSRWIIKKNLSNLDVVIFESVDMIHLQSHFNSRKISLIRLPPIISRNSIKLHSASSGLHSYASMVLEILQEKKEIRTDEVQINSILWLKNCFIYRFAFDVNDDNDNSKNLCYPNFQRLVFLLVFVFKSRNMETFSLTLCRACIIKVTAPLRWSSQIFKFKKI